MNDLGMLSAAPRTIHLGGEDFAIHPLTFADFGMLQSWIDTQFPDPTEIAHKLIESGKYTVVQQRHILTTGMELAARGKRLLGTPEADEKMGSSEGIKQLLVLSIKKGRPEFSQEDADRLYARMTPGDIARVFMATNADMVAGDPKAGAGTETTTAGMTMGPPAAQ